MAHHGAASIIGDLLHVIRVPVEIGDGAVIRARVQHDQVDQIAQLEAAPDSQVVIKLDLAADGVSECYVGESEASLRTE